MVVFGVPDWCCRRRLEAPGPAVELAARLRPDVVIVHSALPRLDGISVTGRITEQSIAPVVMVMTGSDTDLVDQAIDAGAMAALVESDPSSVVAAAEMVLARQADNLSRLTATLQAKSVGEHGELIERAKNLLMTHLRLPEAAAERWLHRTALEEGRRPSSWQPSWSTSGLIVRWFPGRRFCGRWSRGRRSPSRCCGGRWAHRRGPRCIAADPCTIWYMLLDRLVTIAAPPAVVFDRYLDVERWPQWTETVTTVDRLDEGPLAVGSRTRIKQPRLRKAVWDVTELEDGRSFTWVSRSPRGWPPPAGMWSRRSARRRGDLSVEQSGPLGGPVGLLTKRLTRRYLAWKAPG